MSPTHMQQPRPFALDSSIYYIYIYICVCVCVCVYMLLHCTAIYALKNIVKPTVNLSMRMTSVCSILESRATRNHSSRYQSKCFVKHSVMYLVCIATVSFSSLDLFQLCCWPCHMYLSTYKRCVRACFACTWWLFQIPKIAQCSSTVIEEMYVSIFACFVYQLCTIHAPQ
jgi:hypothetical protein